MGDGRRRRSRARCCAGACPLPPVVDPDRRLRARRSASPSPCAARRERDVAVCALQMWAYLAAYKTPHDDERGAGRRASTSTTRSSPTGCSASASCRALRLQRALARNGPDGPDAGATLDRVLVWAHWSWFAVPHGSLALHARAPPRALPAGRRDDLRRVRHRRRLLLARCPRPRPGTPPAPREDGAGGEQLEVRRMMVEYGEHFWRDGWGSLYSVFGGNPLAAMPSLHFATSLMAALLLAEVGPVAGALGSATRPRWASRSSTSASTTSWTCSRAPRLTTCGAQRWRRWPRRPSPGSGGPWGPWRRSLTDRLKQGGSKGHMAAACNPGGERSRSQSRLCAPVPGAEEEMPRVRFTRRQVVAFAVFVLSAVGFLYFVLPKLTGCGGDGPPDRAGRQVVDRRRRVARGALLRRATSSCSAPCS